MGLTVRPLPTFPPHIALMQSGSPVQRLALQKEQLGGMQVCQMFELMQVPLACDMGQVVPQLAFLRNFAGCVELPLRKAAALDPSNLASSDLPERRAAREVSQQNGSPAQPQSSS